MNPIKTISQVLSVILLLFFVVSGCAFKTADADTAGDLPQAVDRPPGDKGVHKNGGKPEKNPFAPVVRTKEGARSPMAPKRNQKEAPNVNQKETLAVNKKEAPKVNKREMPAVSNKEKTIAADPGKYRVIDSPFGQMKVGKVDSAAAALGSNVGKDDSSMGGSVPVESKSPGLAKNKAPETKAPITQPPPKEQPRPQSKPKEPKNENVNGSVGGEKKSQAGDLVLNFEEADLDEVVRMFAEMLHISYIADAVLKGRVTIHTAGSLGKDDLFPVFFQILEINGLTAIMEDGLYRIVKSKDSPQIASLYRVGLETAELKSGERVIIQIVPLKYIAVQEMVKLVTPFMSSGGTVVPHDETNIMLLVDKGENIAKALKMVKVFDIDVFQQVSHRIFPLQYVDAEETAKLMNDVFTTYIGNRKSDMKIIALTHLNAVLMVSRDARAIKKMEEYMPIIDAASEGAEPKIYVYQVKNGEAEDLGSLLNQVFGMEGSAKEKDKKSTSAQEKKGEEPSKPTPFKTDADKPKSEAARAAGSAVESLGSTTLKADIKITPDKIRNALIIEAMPPDYRIVTEILKSIDVLPRQVLIEVTVAEISLDDSTNMGVEWTFLKDKGGIKGFLNASAGAEGLSYSLGLSEEWTNALSALAKREKVNILSTPSVLASDNKEANINISTQIPVASAEYQYTTGTTSSNMLQTNIQYRDTGVILSVTPHINDRGLVSMDVSQEVSEQGQGVDVGGRSYPSFRERSVTTSLTVQHGQTIVIGGLIRESKGDTDMGVPFLSRIPLIGWIFGKTTASISKSELIVMITPHVIASFDDVDEVTREFKKKVGMTIKNIN